MDLAKRLPSDLFFFKGAERSDALEDNCEVDPVWRDSIGNLPVLWCTVLVCVCAAGIGDTVIPGEVAGTGRFADCKLVLEVLRDTAGDELSDEPRELGLLKKLDDDVREDISPVRDWLRLCD